MKYDKSVKDYVLSGVSISDLISGSVDLKRVGNNMRGLCPFHSEKTPSFYVSDARMSYYCFGCKEHGNAIDFVMQTEKLDFLEALESLADRYAIDLSSYLLQESESGNRQQAEQIYKINLDAAKYFHANLLKNGHALEYFKDRAVKPETIKRFGLGYASDAWTALSEHLKAKGYGEEEICTAQLAVKRESGGIYDRFRNRLIFPIFDYRSRVLGFGGRSMGAEMPKYLNSSESSVFQKSKILYGDRISRKAGKSDFVILVEGYMDLLQVYQAGFPNVLASMGTALTEEQAYSISKRYKFVLFAYDMDEAGRNAIARSIPLLEKYGIEVKIVDCSPAKDPDEFIKRFGFRALKERLESAENKIRFHLKSIKNKYNLRDAAERYRFVTESISYISHHCKELEAEIYLQELAELSSIQYDKILSEYRNFSKRQRREVLAQKPTLATDQGETKAHLQGHSELSYYERQLLALSVHHRDFALKIFDRTSGDFFTEGASSTFSFLMMYYATRADFDPLSFSEEVDLEAAIRLQELYDQTESEFTEKELDFFLDRWEAEKIKMEIDKIDDEIRNLTFFEDGEAEIRLRALRKKRSMILKTIYEKKNKHLNTT